MNAREIIAMCQHDHGLTFPSEFEVADHVIDRLTSAGFHILGPDEIDGPTGWQPIETTPTPPARFRVNGLCADHDKLTWFVEGEPTHWMPFPSEPTAIRALKEKRT